MGMRVYGPNALGRLIRSSQCISPSPIESYREFVAPDSEEVLKTTVCLDTFNLQIALH